MRKFFFILAIQVVYCFQNVGACPKDSVGTDQSWRVFADYTDAKNAKSLTGEALEADKIFTPESFKYKCTVKKTEFRGATLSRTIVTLKCDHSNGGSFETDASYTVFMSKGSPFYSPLSVRLLGEDGRSFDIVIACVANDLIGLQEKTYNQSSQSPR